MKKVLTGLLLLCVLAACSDKATQLYETARFEELQNNRDHAVMLYREIVEKHPDSAEAKEAAKRLSELQK